MVEHDYAVAKSRSLLVLPVLVLFISVEATVLLLVLPELSTTRLMNLMMIAVLPERLLIHVIVAR